MKNYSFCLVTILILSFLTFASMILTYTEKPIVILTTSYNNEKWVEKNLSSVLSQHYSNYRVLYFDDCSTDKTYEEALRIISQYHAQGRVELIRNKEFVGCPAGNWYKAIHSCKDDEIIIHVDGDDWLPHENVLSRINEVYSNSNIWLTYGQFKSSNGEMGHCRPFPQVK